MNSKSKNKISLSIKEKNGYNNLSYELRDKLDLSDNSPNLNINKYVTWDEFCTIFNSVTLHFVFYYDNFAIYLEHDKDKFYFWVEGEKGKTIDRKQSKSSNEILNYASVNGIHLKDLWQLLH